MKASELLIKYLHLFAAIAFITIGLSAAWLVDASHPIVFIVIGFLGGDIYRSGKGIINN